MTDIPYSQELLRKLIHLSSLWMPALIIYVPVNIAAACFFSLFIINVLAEYGYYKKWTFFINTYGHLFSKMLRKKENNENFHLSGSPYVLAAALCCCLLFTPVNAATALSVMLIADTAAALIGRRCGKHKINQNTKSIEGTFAFFLFGFGVICTAALLFQTDFPFLMRGTVGVLLATLAELYENQLKIDDNFSVPLIVGACLSL